MAPARSASLVAIKAQPVLMTARVVIIMTIMADEIVELTCSAVIKR